MSANPDTGIDLDVDAGWAADRTGLDLAIDQAVGQAALAVGRKLREVLTTTRFGVVTVEVRNGQVFVGGGATVRIENAQWTMQNGQ